MKKMLLGLFLLGSILFAGIKDVEVTPRFIKTTKLKIIDIRTESEWVRYGIIKEAFLLTFFDRFGDYDIDAFTKKLDNIIDKGEKFAIIDHAGGRTKLLSHFLGNERSYNVINLKGGMVKLLKQGYKPTFHSLSIN